MGPKLVVVLYWTYRYCYFWEVSNPVNWGGLNIWHTTVLEDYIDASKKSFKAITVVTWKILFFLNEKDTISVSGLCDSSGFCTKHFRVEGFTVFLVQFCPNLMSCFNRNYGYKLPLKDCLLIALQSLCNSILTSTIIEYSTFAVYTVY